MVASNSSDSLVESHGSFYCGASPFWDWELFWDSKTPVLGECFIDSVITWIPFIVILSAIIINWRQWKQSAGIKGINVLRMERNGHAYSSINTCDTNETSDSQSSHDTQDTLNTFDTQSEYNHNGNVGENLSSSRCRFIFLCKFTLTVLILWTSVFHLCASVFHLLAHNEENNGTITLATFTTNNSDFLKDNKSAYNR